MGGKANIDQPHSMAKFRRNPGRWPAWANCAPSLPTINR